MSSDLDGAVWRKSGYSGGNGGHCVELAFTEHVTGVRDSTNATGPVLEFARLGEFIVSAVSTADDTGGRARDRS
jgi:hypothetical protein